MGWFSKNEEVPNLALAPILPELPKKDESKKKGLPELPTFPSNPKSENFNQEIVKSTVGDISSSGENLVNRGVPRDFPLVDTPQRESFIPPMLAEIIPEPPRQISIPSKAGAYRTAQDPSWYSDRDEPIKEIPTKSIHEIHKRPVEEIPKMTFELNNVPDNKHVQKKVEPIFVRIDKFQLAQKNFEQIKDKIKDMESVLGKINDVKLKEEVELKGWTEDVEKIKLQLSEIDSSIFNQI